jgi:hypothetical protein
LIPVSCNTILVSADLDNGGNNDDEATTTLMITINTLLQGYSDAINGAFGVANDAFYYGDASGRMYQDWYGVQALTFQPRFLVHYGM